MVGEKSGKSQGILLNLNCGHPVKQPSNYELFSYIVRCNVNIRITD